MSAENVLRSMTVDETSFHLWPRLLDLKKAAAYLSVGRATIRDWVHDGILQPVQLPGSALRDRHGSVAARPSQRRLSKMLFDRKDLDEFIEFQKREATE